MSHVMGQEGKGTEGVIDYRNSKNTVQFYSKIEFYSTVEHGGDALTIQRQRNLKHETNSHVHHTTFPFIILYSLKLDKNHPN